MAENGLTISMGMHMRHQSEVRPIARFQKEGHARNKPEHGVLVLRVRHPNDNEENTGDEGDGVDPDFLAPYAGTRVNEVADHAA